MIPVVLSGGMGTRLWPLSRAAFPKQFCELMDESLLDKTLKRLTPMGSPWTLTTKELSTLTERAFRGLQIPLDQVIYEPVGRNTAPAIALLCRILALRGHESETVGIFPADHLVSDEKAFISALELAQACAQDGQVVTLGIQPSYPATGFGYIETTKECFRKGTGFSAFATAGFREKPDHETAKAFLAQGGFYWNAGIFVFKVSTMIGHFQRLMPELWEKMSLLREDLSNLEAVYSSVESISIDYGIMEKLKEQVCVPCDIGWSDLGSWDDIASYNADPLHLYFANRADVMASESKNSFVFSSNKKVFGLVDVDDLIVVDTPDATLIAKKGSSQKVRKVVDQLKQTGHSAARDHQFELRPWGRFEVLRDEAHYKSKRILVDPGGQISYQSHAKRNEHWVIVKGQGEVVLNGETIVLKTGESVFIPAGTKHRIKNTGDQPLEFIEVQTGTYFGEDDIVRYQDDYNRA